MQKSIVGIDISKKDFSVSLLKEHKHNVQVFPNNAKGYEEFIHWLAQLNATPDIFCMEATGSYGEA